MLSSAYARGAEGVVGTEGAHTERRLWWKEKGGVLYSNGPGAGPLESLATRCNCHAVAT